MWKMIWDLNVPPKIRNFMWRAVSNILPMQDNLYRRKVAVESTYEFCRQHPETKAHLLWECSQGRSQEFLFGGAKCDTNTFIKTTSTHIYIHIRALFYYIYTLFI